MTDYSDKNWLRPKPRLFSRAARFIGDMLIVLVVLLILGWLINMNELRAQGKTFAVLLENSTQPATLSECQRARPDLERPIRVVSKQQRTNEPWHHRTCIWSLA